MPKEIWLASDHHFGDSKICDYLDYRCNKNRPFHSLDEMHTAIIDNHNSVVKPFDKVIFAGDCVINAKYFPLLDQLNGHLRLVRGNHDIFKDKFYHNYFEQLHGVKVIADKKVMITHIPIHPDSIKDGWVNICGHLHNNPVPDERYICVCLEQINYTPVNLDDLLKGR